MISKQLSQQYIMMYGIVCHIMAPVSRCVLYHEKMYCCSPNFDKLPEGGSGL